MQAHANDLVRILGELFIVRRDAYGLLTRSERQQKWTYPLQKDHLDVPLPITDDLLRDHVSDSRTCIGIPMLTYPGSVGKVACIDLDHESRFDPLIWPFVQFSAEQGVTVLVERSKRGRVHLWLPFEEPIPGERIRGIVRRLIESFAVEQKELGQLFYTGIDGQVSSQITVEMFPKQSVLTDRNPFGNLVSLPLCGRFIPEGRTVFVNPETLEPISDQVGYLGSIARISPDAANRLWEEAERSRPPAAEPPGGHARARAGKATALPSRILPCVCTALEGVSEGSRALWAFQLGIDLHRRGYSEDQALQIGREWHSRCAPGSHPFTWEEAERQIRSGYHSGLTYTNCEAPHVSRLCNRALCPLENWAQAAVPPVRREIEPEVLPVEEARQAFRERLMDAVGVQVSPSGAFAVSAMPADPAYELVVHPPSGHLTCLSLPPGLGKTTQFLGLVHRLGDFGFMMLASDRRLIGEILERYLRILRREHPETADSEEALSREVMVLEPITPDECRNYEEITRAYSLLSPSSKRAICRSCPDRDDCRFRRQWREAQLARLVIASHDMWEAIDALDSEGPLRYVNFLGDPTDRLAIAWDEDPTAGFLSPVRISADEVGRVIGELAAVGLRHDAFGRLLTQLVSTTESERLGPLDPDFDVVTALGPNALDRWRRHHVRLCTERPSRHVPDYFQHLVVAIRKGFVVHIMPNGTRVMSVIHPRHFNIRRRPPMLILTPEPPGTRELAAVFGTDPGQIQVRHFGVEAPNVILYQARTDDFAKTKTRVEALREPIRQHLRWIAETFDPHREKFWFLGCKLIYEPVVREAADGLGLRALPGGEIDNRDGRYVLMHYHHAVGTDIAAGADIAVLYGTPYRSPMDIIALDTLLRAPEAVFTPEELEEARRTGRPPRLAMAGLYRADRSGQFWYDPPLQEIAHRLATVPMVQMMGRTRPYLRRPDQEPLLIFLASRLDVANDPRFLFLRRIEPDRVGMQLFEPARSRYSENRLLVQSTVEQLGECRPADVMRATGLPKETVQRIMRKLAADTGPLVRTGNRNRPRYRPRGS